MKKLGAAMLLAAVITGVGAVAPASAASLSASTPDLVQKKVNPVSPFAIWPRSD